MYDLTIEEFPPDRLADIARWRNDPDVNRYLRQGIRTLEEVQEWYAQYFARAEKKLVRCTLTKSSSATVRWSTLIQPIAVAK
jgi:hypothetical protein